MNDLGRMYHAFHTQHGKYGFAHHLTTKGRFLRNEIGAGKRVLDLGSRDGTLTTVFASGNDVVCLDVDPYAVELCKRGGLEAICGDLNSGLPFTEGSFDVVVLADVLEHVLLGRGLLAEIRRVLRPGGLCLGSTPNAFYWSDRLKLFTGKDPATYSDPTHVRHFSRQSLESELSCFFYRIEIVPYGHNPLARRLSTLCASDFFWRCWKESTETEPEEQYHGPNRHLDCQSSAGARRTRVEYLPAGKGSGPLGP